MAKKTSNSRAKTDPAPDTTPAAAPAKPRTRARATKTAADNSVASDSSAPTSLSASSAQSSSVSMSSEPSEDDVRLRAYHRYLERGGGHGMDFEDWLEAKRDLNGNK